MRILKDAHQARAFRAACTQAGQTLGFVPTMGALHEAHLALAHQSQRDNAATLVSIFVNPTQFNNPEDLEKYPRRVESDLEGLEKAGVDAVYLPSVGDIYGQQVKSEPLDLAGLDRGMEGTYRPGHFPGVATVIKRFFEILQPDRAYFGQKDYQQLRVVQHITKQHQLGVEVIGCETVRTKEGLAMSSRNYRLSEQGWQDALLIPQALQWARENHDRHSPGSLKEGVQKFFNDEPLKLEYVEIADPETMRPLREWLDAKHARIFLAAFCEGVRLIDNQKLF
ncbi:MAG: pantoate--beta-alanine ligase [Schleiferiaceae bacterium]|nr:pantoate--beta-alanine ligase [Schleiferiaceae bacterium]